MNHLKTKWSPLTFLFLFIFTLNSCVEKQKPNEEDKDEPIEVEKPKTIISLEDADAIYNNYSKHRIAAIENYETNERAPSKKFQAARFVDFDYETLKNYIAYVDQEASRAGVKKVTKLRLYFANYPDKEQFPDKKEVVHPRQNSIFMVPTLEKNGKNYSFYIGEDGKPKLIIDWKAEIQKGMGLQNKQEPAQASIMPSFSLNSSFYVGSSLVLNRGHGGPPPRTEFE